MSCSGNFGEKTVLCASLPGLQAGKEGRVGGEEEGVVGEGGGAPLILWGGVT